jgi:RND superfamily putative drug exporter
VITGGLIILILGGLLASGTLGALSLSRFEAPGSESRLAANELLETFDVGAANMLLLITVQEGTLDRPATTLQVQEVAERLSKEPSVATVETPWNSPGKIGMVSADRRHALILARLPGSATETRSLMAELSPRYTMQTGNLSIGVGGGDEVFRQVGAEAARDFARAEIIIFPGVFLLLLLFFRNVAAAILPIAVGLFAMISTLAALRLLASVTEVSTFALNLTLVLGLGLGVDYGLFVLARFREARADGRTVPEAVAVSVATAGKTVLFSGITVAASLAALLVFPSSFLRSFAYAGVAVVMFGMLGATVLLPAMLAVFGRWISPAKPGGASGLWHRTAIAVMRRPVVFGLGAMAILVLLGSPVRDIAFGLPDDRVLPEGASSRTVHQTIRENFSAEVTDSFLILARGEKGTPPDTVAIDTYARALSRVAGIAEVDSAAGGFVNGEQVRAAPTDTSRWYRGEATWLAATPLSDRLETDPLAFVEDMRRIDAPFETLIGGYPADLADFRLMVMNWLPLAAAIIFGSTIVILFLMTGSVLLPLKATVLNLVSLSALFGALVYVFQQGHFADLLDFTPTGRLESSIPILMFCIAYGLSMDYEVFMLSRIKEEHDRGLDNASAVAVGLERSGPLITAAAVVLAFSFLAYLTSGVVFLKMLGLGLALAILVDATLIRAVLVPVFMRLAGDLNWWAPRPLRRFHARFGIRE